MSMSCWEREPFGLLYGLKICCLSLGNPFFGEGLSKLQSKLSAVRFFSTLPPKGRIKALIVGLQEIGFSRPSQCAR